MAEKFPRNSILLKAQPKNQWLLFERPVEVLELFSASDLHDALYYLDRQVNGKGLYAAGFLSYEAGAAFDSALKVKNDPSFPLLWFGLYERAQKLESPLDPEAGLEKLGWVPELDYQEYMKGFLAIKEHIRRGDTYQVNYTFRLKSDFTCDPWPFFSTLAAGHHPPHAAYVNTDRYTICSFSPELFFSLDQDTLLSRPMKGTLPRKCLAWDDQNQAGVLKRCPKNRAENVMITDMVRNDLGRIADPGSVRVRNLLGAEKYPTLWQMTSTVICRTRARLPAILGALFPPSSITGAPKASTMDIISRLEISPRRIYTGSIGYIGPERLGRFNVAIRTVLVDKDAQKAEYGVGGGIVWDSIAPDEWDECRTKARSLQRFGPAFSLLETMLWTPEGGYHLLGAHLDRLKSSAGYFDFKFDFQEIIKSLEVFARDLSRECWKIRLLVDEKGLVSIEKMTITAPALPLTLSPARKAVDSSNPFLYHKTTHREVYNSAQPQNPEASGVILWNEKNEVTESRAANIALRMDGVLYTPPVRCGLLAGTYRQFLISAGVVKEKIILLKDLKSCQDIFLMNSVRGFIRARLVRGQRSEIRSQRSGFRSPQSEDGKK
jgi:para-aminobenzoate synthetase / 4-amino-4-deoxychorismate lyase